MFVNLFIVRAFEAHLCISQSYSIEVDCESDYNDENGVIPVGNIGDIVGVLIPAAPALNFHSLPIVFSNSSLHDILVAGVFASIDKRFFSLQTNLLC